MFGNPYTPMEIYKILTNNYVENNDNGKIYFGFDTGLGEAAILFGGFVLVDINGKYVGNIKDQNLWTITAVANKKKFFLKKEYQNKKQNKSRETETLETTPEKITDFQKQNNRKLYKLQGNLIEYFKIQDKANFYRNIWDINKLGCFDYMRSKFPYGILDKFINVSKENEALFAGISSAGPSMFALARDINKAINIKQKLENELCSYFSDFNVGKASEKIKYKIKSY